ncbi:phage integrase family protein [Cupriavidus necator]
MQDSKDSETAPLARSQVAALRAWLQGVPLEIIAGRWLSADPEVLPSARETLATLHALRDRLQQRARQHGREDLAAACAAPGRSGVGMDRAVAALRELETLGTPVPELQHGVHLWFAGPLARRLQRAGIGTLAELIRLCNQRGRSWWRHVPRVGPLAAQRVVAVLARHGETLGQLGVHVTGAALPLPRAPATLQPGAGTAVPFEAMRLPRTLDGSAGRNRAPRAECVIAALDDYQAIQTWLSLWPEDSQTWRAYRKEAERFLAWLILERGRAFSDALTDDCLAYRAFLADPQPAARWCGPRVPRTVTVGGERLNHPAWRPFTGPLSARSRSYSETVLSALCAWLAGRRYLATNPWEGLPKARHVTPALQVERAVPTEIWHRMADWLDAQAGRGSRARLWRAAVLLLRETGLRCDEAARADAADLVPRPDSGKLAKLSGVWGELRICGKGGRIRQVPVSDRLWTALLAHWTDRDEVPGLRTGGSLLAPLPGPRPPRVREKTKQGRDGYSGRGLRQLVEQAGAAFAASLAVSDPELASQGANWHPHAWRHAFASQGLAAGMGLDVMQQYLGHASLATTTLYTTTDRDRRLQDVEKLYRKR